MSKSKNITILGRIKAISAFKKAVIAISLAVFIISLTRPAYFIDRPDYDAWAHTPTLLLVGWIGFLGGGWESIFWLANPAYFIAIYLYVKGNRRAVVFALIAFFIAASFSMLTDITSNENGARTRITSFEWGYKFWVISLAILAAGVTITYIRDRRSRTPVS